MYQAALVPAIYSSTVTDKGKTLVAAAVLAAAVGVYLEISYEQKLKTAPSATPATRAPSASAASSAPGAPGSARAAP